MELYRQDVQVMVLDQHVLFIAFTEECMGPVDQAHFLNDPSERSYSAPLLFSWGEHIGERGKWSDWDKVHYHPFLTLAFTWRRPLWNRGWSFWGIFEWEINPSIMQPGISVFTIELKMIIREWHLLSVFSSSGTPVLNLFLERQIPNQDDGEAQGCRDTTVRKKEMSKMYSGNVPPLELDLLGGSSHVYLNKIETKDYCVPDVQMLGFTT